MENKEKKKHPILKTIGIVFAVLFILGIIGSFIPDTDTSGQTVAKTGTVGDASVNNESKDVKKESKVEESVDEAQEESEEISEETSTEDKYYMLGTPLNFKQNGEPFTATITDVGFMELSSGIDRGILVYMVVEIENNGDNSITFYNNDFSLYVDNYQCNNSPITMSNETVMQTNITINPGRKGIFTYRSLLPTEYQDTDSIETLEIGMGSTSIYIKDNYQYIYGGNNISTDVGDDWYIFPIEDEYYGFYTNGDTTISIYRDRADQGNVIIVEYPNGNMFEGYLEILMETTGEIYDNDTWETVATFEFTSDNTIKITSDTNMAGTYHKE